MSQGMTMVETTARFENRNLGPNGEFAMSSKPGVNVRCNTNPE